MTAKTDFEQIKGKLRVLEMLFDLAGTASTSAAGTELDDVDFFYGIEVICRECREGLDQLGGKS